MQNKLLVFLFLFSSILLAEVLDWTIPYEKGKNFSGPEGDVDLMAYLEASEGSLLSSEVTLAGKKKLLSTIQWAVEQVNEGDLKRFDTLLAKVKLLLCQRICFSDSCLLLESFSRDPVCLDCDTMTYTVMMVLQRVQQKYPEYGLLRNVFATVLYNHVPMAVRLGNGSMVYVDVNVKGPLVFETKEAYVTSASVYRNEPFVPFSGKVMESLPLAACGTWCLGKGDVKKATAFFEKALVLCPEDTNIKGSLALYCCVWKDPAKTVEWLEQASQLGWEKDRLCLYLHWGNAYALLKRYEEAVKMYTKGIERKADNMPVLVYYQARAYAYARLGKEKEAEEDFRRSVELFAESINE